MNLSTQPYKGARDFYPEDKRIQKYMFNKLRKVVESFGYQEYDAPIIEPMELYLSKSSDEIISEQTYSFTDRGDRKVTLRPEMTPTVSRMVAGRRQELAYPLRWYSIPNLWRYERPQKGRLREHWQLNVDIFGVEGIEADHEIILIADQILKSFGATPEMYEIRLNSRKLFNALSHEYLEIDDVTTRELSRTVDKLAKMEPEDFKNEFKNVLGTLKEPAKAEVLLDFFFNPNWDNIPVELTSDQIIKELQKLMRLLSESGIRNVKFSPAVVRGFDYYTDIVFEVFDTDPENNRSMFGGGRYDGLVAQFGVEPVPTVGFGMGDVTLQNFLEAHKLLPDLKPETDAVVILVGDVYDKAQPAIAELRQNGLNLAVDSSGRKLDAQIKSAVKSGVRYAIFIGDKELAGNKYKLRDLEKGEEKDLSLDQVAGTLAAHR